MALEHLIITLEEVKKYLRVEHNADDELISLLIETSKEQAQHYLNHDFTMVDEEGIVRHTTIPLTIKLACLKMINSWYDYRDDTTEQSSMGDVSRNVGEVPWDAERLLMPYRRLVGM